MDPSLSFSSTEKEDDNHDHNGNINKENDEDFEVEEDTLIVFVPEANDPAEEIELRYDSDENALRAFWRNEEVAVLNGLNDSDASNVDISIIDAADLQLAGFA